MMISHNEMEVLRHPKSSTQSPEDEALDGLRNAAMVVNHKGKKNQENPLLQELFLEFRKGAHVMHNTITGIHGPLTCNLCLHAPGLSTNIPDSP